MILFHNHKHMLIRSELLFKINNFLPSMTGDNSSRHINIIKLKKGEREKVEIKKINKSEKF